MVASGLRRAWPEPAARLRVVFFVVVAAGILVYQIPAANHHRNDAGLAGTAGSPEAGWRARHPWSIKFYVLRALGILM